MVFCFEYCSLLETDRRASPALTAEDAQSSAELVFYGQMPSVLMASATLPTPTIIAPFLIELPDFWDIL